MPKKRHYSYEEKKRFIEIIESSSSVKEGCKKLGISRNTYYLYKKTIEQSGIEGLKKNNHRVSKPSLRIPMELENQVIEYSVENPLLGCQKIANHFNSNKKQVSPSTVRNIWKKNNLETRHHRYNVLLRKVHVKENNLSGKQKEAFGSSQPFLPYVARYAGQSIICHKHLIAHTKDKESYYFIFLFDVYSGFSKAAVVTSIKKKNLSLLCKEFIPKLKSTTFITDDKMIADYLRDNTVSKNIRRRVLFSNKYLSSTMTGKLIQQLQKEVVLPYFSGNSTINIKALQRKINTFIQSHNSYSAPLYGKILAPSPNQLVKELAPTKVLNQRSHDIVDKYSKEFLPIDTYSEISDTRQNSRHEPPPGKTFFFLGQEKNFMLDYLGFHHHKPYGYSIYSSLRDNASYYGDEWSVFGCQNLGTFTDCYPDAAFSLAIYIVEMDNIPAKILAGELDHHIEALSNALKKCSHSVYLRIGHEMDVGHIPISPKVYKKTYRYIHKKIKAILKDQASFVWHTGGGKTDNNMDVMEWYPGDKYTDWIGFNIFDWPYHGYNNPYSLNLIHQARKRSKPTMICASSAVNGIHHEGSEAWNFWFADVLSFIHRYNIKAFTWCHYNFHQLESLQYRKWGDARIYKNNELKRLWDSTLASARFLM